MRKLSLAVLSAVALLVTVVAPAQATNDQFWKRQYGPEQIGAPLAWSKTRGAGVTIAIVDSGVDVDHPDLKGKLLPGRDFADADDNPDDDSNLKDGNNVVVKGHGTHVAGIAAAITDNGTGIAGVAPDAKLLPLKVFSSKPTASILDALTAIPNAIRYAVDQGAKVINLSVGTFQGSSLVGVIETPCAEAFNRGALCVVAAGNSGDNPSGYDKNVQFLNVTANDKNGEHAAFGQHADTQWALSAPGVAIYSTVPVEDGGYGEKQGTSMAAPHAAGVAALLFAQNLTAKQVVDRMLTTARAMGNAGVNGAGRVDAAAAAGASAAGAATGTTVSTLRSSGGRTGGGGAAAPGGGTKATTRDGQPISGGKGTATTALTEGSDDAGDDFAFSGGPAAANEVRGGTLAKKAEPVSTGLLVVTLAAIAAFGLGWGGLTAARRRASGASGASGS